MNISGSSYLIDGFLSTGTVLRSNNSEEFFVSEKKGDRLFLMCHSCSVANVFQLNKLGGIISLVCQQCGHPLSLKNEIKR